MSEKNHSKQRLELLLPGDTAWQLWSGNALGTFTLATTFSAEAEGSFATSAARHTLALPATSLWVLPAWLQGEPDHLRDIASLHLERLGVKTPGHAESLAVESLQNDGRSHLARIIALKDVATPLADYRILPDDCRLSALCYALPTSSLILWRELGRLVIAITVGPRLAYFSPMSAARLDANGLAELNNICLQLTFQKVLTALDSVVLWMDEGDAEHIQRTIGLPVLRGEKPTPQPSSFTTPLGKNKAAVLMPADIIAQRETTVTKAKHRLLGLSIGFGIAACVALFAGLMALATRERDALQDQLATLMPRHAKVAEHKKSWQEVATATDPDYLPMELLLRCMEPSASATLSVTSFECSPDSIIISGRTPEVANALKYSEQLKATESLAAFAWEASTPEIAADNSASFELKGTRQ